MTKISIKRSLYILLGFGILIICLSTFIVNKEAHNGNKMVVLSLADIAIGSIIKDASETLITGANEGFLSNKITDLVNLPAIVSIKITDRNGFVEFEKSDPNPNLEDVNIQKREIVDILGNDDNLLDTNEPAIIGYLYVGINEKQLTKPYMEGIKISLILAFIDLVCVTLMIHWIFNRRVVIPAKEMTKILSDGIMNPSEEKLLENLYGDEIGSIAEQIDLCIEKLFLMNKNKEIIEDEIIRIENHSDSVNVASYMTIGETIDNVSPLLEELMDVTNEAIAFAPINNNTKKKLFGLLGKINFEFNKLEHVTMNPLVPNMVTISLERLIKKISNESNIKIDILPIDNFKIMCKADVTRIQFFFNSISRLLSDELNGRVFTKFKESRIICTFVLYAAGKNISLTEMDVVLLNEIFKNEAEVDIENSAFNKHELSHLVFLKEVIGIDITFMWSSIIESIEIYVVIPFSTECDQLGEGFERKKTKKIAIVSNSNPDFLPYSKILLNVEIDIFKYEMFYNCFVNQYDYFVLDSEGISGTVINKLALQIKNKNTNQKLFLLSLGIEKQGDISEVFDYYISKPISSSRLLKFIYSTETTGLLLKKALKN